MFAIAGSGGSPGAAAIAEAWTRMFRGFNGGTIGFEKQSSPPLRGSVPLEAAIRAIAERQRQ